MNPEIATIERVRSAAAQLRVSGIAVTADRIIARLGGGSKSTVLKHLKVMRGEIDVEPTLPTALLESARPLLAAVFAAGERAGDERQQSKLELLDRSLMELEAQVEELASEILSLQTSKTILGEERDAAVKLRLQYEERLRAVLQENAMGQGNAAIELNSIVERLEATVTAVQGTKTARPTVTLKGNDGQRRQQSGSGVAAGRS